MSRRIEYTSDNSGEFSSKSLTSKGYVDNTVNSAFIGITSSSVWTSGETGTRSIVAQGHTGTNAIGNYAVAWGTFNTASGEYSTSYGQGNTAAGQMSHAEGLNNTVNSDYSHAEGGSNTLSLFSSYSHAEGSFNYIDGLYSHAEGYSNTIGGSSIASHVEGSGTTANALGSHTEGLKALTLGQYSHAEGVNTATGLLYPVLSVVDDTSLLVQGDVSSGVTIGQISYTVDTGFTVDTTYNTIADIQVFNSYTSTTFNFGSGFDGPVNDIVYNGQTGQYIVGGNFFTYNGESISCIARLNSDGSLDTSFAQGTGFNGQVNKIHIQNDGKILVCGQFSSYDGNPGNGLARLNSNGTYDNTLVVATDTDGPICSIATDSNNNIIAVGSFNTYDNNTVGFLFKIDQFGLFDSTFALNIGTGFNYFDLFGGIIVQPDDKILIAGYFNSFNGNSYNGLIRLNNDGTIDSSLVIGDGVGGGGANIKDLALLDNGDIIIVGEFRYWDLNSVGNLAKLDSTGAFDSAFTTNNGSGANKPLYAVKVLPDGNILVGGDVDLFSGNLVGNLTRLLPDGSIDLSFNVGSGLNERVNTFSLDTANPSLGFLVGGNFTLLDDSIPASYITALNGFSSPFTKITVDANDWLTSNPIAIFADPNIGIGMHAEGGNTFASGDYSHASGKNSFALGTESFIHSTNSIVFGNRSAVIGGTGITAFADDTLYVPHLNIQNANTSTNLNVLIRELTGEVRENDITNFLNSYWNLTGNSSTSATTNFIGTIDAQDLVFKTDNTEAFRVDNTQKIGIGTSIPTERLEVSGNVKSSGGYFAAISDVKSAPYTIQLSDYTILSDAQDITLPTAVGIKGRIFVVKNVNTEPLSAVTIYADGSETIDGSSSTSTRSVRHLQSDGSNWVIIV